MTIAPSALGAVLLPLLLLLLVLAGAPASASATFAGSTTTTPPPTAAPTQAAAAAVSVPGASDPPTGIGGNGRIVGTWSAPADDGGSVVTQYRLLALRPDGTAAGYCQVAAPTLSCVVSGLSNGSSYTLKVRVWNAVGYGPLSVASGPILVGIPGAAAAPRGFRGDTFLVGTWSAPADDGGSVVTQYRLLAFRPDGTAAGYCQVAAPTSSCVVSGLSNGTSYTLKVRVWNAVGYGPLSVASGPVTPAITRPGEATNPRPLTVTTTAGQAPSTTTVDTAGLPSTPDPGHNSYFGDPNAVFQTAWYSWTAPISARVVLFNRVCSTDSFVAVYSGFPTEGTLQARDDDSGPGLCFGTGFAATADTTYYIAIEPWGAGREDMSVDVWAGATPDAPTDLAVSALGRSATVDFTPPQFGTFEGLDWGALSVTDYSYRIDAGPWLPTGQTSLPAPGSLAVRASIPGLARGRHTVEVRAGSRQGAGPPTAPIGFLVPDAPAPASSLRRGRVSLGGGSV